MKELKTTKEPVNAGLLCRSIVDTIDRGVTSSDGYGGLNWMAKEKLEQELLALVMCIKDDLKS